METVDIGETKQVRSRKKKVNDLRERELFELKDLLQQPAARAFFWRILTACGMFSSMSGHDPQSMAIRSGKRDMGLWLVAELDAANKDAYIMCFKEQERRETE